MNLLGAETFDETFGGKSTRKRPKLASLDYESLLQRSEAERAKYQDPTHKYVAVPIGVSWIGIVWFLGQKDLGGVASIFSGRTSAIECRLGDGPPGGFTVESCLCPCLIPVPD